ncbi:hypothetical protein [Nocardia sp. XZ_19_231]|uniref:hypothetical protein n=1 Tax=Nocardia sp. XZ_19_231 TaxID=2769252 RepID=UPI00188DD06E|nr:hypothetical protein [Nocardia sp. XZ_19_231]
MSYGGAAPVPVVEPADRGTPSWWPLASSVIIGVVVLCCLGLLWTGISKADLDLTLGLLLSLAFTGLLWAVWSMTGLVVYRVGWISLVAPGVVVVTMGISWSGLPDRLGWWLSESAMTQAAQTCDPADGDRRIGVYSVGRVSTRDNGCLLTVSGMGLVSPAGFAYMPAGEPPAARGEYDEQYTHLDGSWYRFST